MEITIKGSEKELAAFVAELQKQQRTKKFTPETANGPVTRDSYNCTPN